MHTHTHKHANTHTQANAQTKGARGREGGRPRDSRTIRCLAHAQGPQKIKKTRTRVQPRTHQQACPPGGRDERARGGSRGRIEVVAAPCQCLGPPKKAHNTRRHTRTGGKQEEAPSTEGRRRGKTTGDRRTAAEKANRKKADTAGQN